MCSEFLDPKNDVAFKRIFETEKNKDILIHFLNGILDLLKKKEMIVKAILDKKIAEGLEIDYAQSYAEGYAEGYIEGYIEGFAQGFVLGYAIGCTLGYALGLIEGLALLHVAKNQGMSLEGP